MEREKTKRGVHGGKFLKQKRGGGMLGIHQFDTRWIDRRSFPNDLLGTAGCVAQNYRTHTHTRCDVNATRL